MRLFGNGMRAFTVAVLLLILGGIGALLIIGSHVSYSLLGTNLASLWNGTAETELTAKAYLIAELETGEVVLEKNKDIQYPIASITKLFTAVVVNDGDLLSKETVIVWEDFVTEGTAGALWLGQTYSVRGLLFPLLLSSSNDAAAAIIRVVGNETFTTLRKELIEAAGLTQTVLVDASGLSDENVSTASELVVFLRYVKHTHEYILDITTLASYLGPYHGWVNNNPAAVYENFQGGKHGYTYAAGRTFAGIFEKGDKEYAIVLLGSEDLAQDLKTMVGMLP